jgi:hypothetical protein
MRYRLYYKNTEWDTYGNCWDNEDPEICCPAEDPEDRIILARRNEHDYWIKMLPEEFRSTVSKMAYDRGHSAGEEEVLLILQDLVSDLLPCFEKWLEERTV